MKKFLKYAVTAVVTAVVTLAVAFLLLGGDLMRIAEQVCLMKKITTVDTKANKKAVYFDVDSDTVGDNLAKAYIDMIDDDYSAYFDEEDYSEKQDEREGIANKSIGITISIKSGEKYPSVIYVHRNSPAKEAGLQVGDRMISINGVSLKDETTAKAVGLIKEKDTARITVKRGDKKLEFSVELKEFVLDSVSWKMIDETCVINITEFEESTVSQFDEALKFAEDKGAKSLVFDLRDNPGGYVDSCAKILDKICPKGDLVRMKYKDGSVKVAYTSDEEEINLPISVIVNQNTASAAEIFALNIRDYNKGKLVGVKTFGKGIAQTTYEIGDGTAVKFTTATIVDENGDTYHKEGIMPDYEVTLSEEEMIDYLYWTDEEDFQLQKALQIVK